MLCAVKPWYMAKVTLKNITKVFDKNVTAVDNFNLEIEDKEFIVLVGPSGCGKTTTLRMVAGLEEITDGELYIDDRMVNSVAPKERDIAMVFQNYALYPHMSVYDNMAFALKLRKMPRVEIDKKVKDTAKMLGITELLQRKPKALSGGQRQRVAIGRAIVREPKVFLMDEPLSNLDAKLRNQMRAELIKLHRDIGTTFIYVTHDQTEAMTLGDRIVIMKDGFIQQIGSSQEVFNRPANLFVAGFIGTPQMNFFPAEIALSEGKYVVRVSTAEIVLPDDRQKILQQKKQAPTKITLGIRPEHISLVPKDTPGSIKAKVDVSEMMGSEIFLHVAVDDKDIIIRVQTKDMDQYAFEQGKANYISFKIPPTLIQLFDPTTEKNIWV
jgi:ABC-type sugar transport systems, ATPase components